ncbi:MAG TPA: phosphoadenosine phosphosulfate reductase family protein [Bacteroidota bacterium]|nr:phosphoadenosine phosphosulfate reductase family protein [Bacteroidota bacterium]
MRVLERVRAQAQAILVSFSGGKDSLVCMDLATDVFGRGNVVGYFMYFVRGLSYETKQLDYARKRWGVEILQYPHPDLALAIKTGAYRFAPEPKRKLFKLKDVERRVRIDTGLHWIVNGARQADSRDRCVMLRTYEDEAIYEKGGRVFPISKWKDREVLAYMKHHRIPVPQVFKGNVKMSGTGLGGRALAAIMEQYPEDYRKILKVFPLAGNAVARLKLHGV